MENVEESLELHDKYQFEVKFTYPLDKTVPYTEYNVETFMFIPNNLCVNHTTYTKDDFYSDMQKYIRLKTPTMLLKNILNDDKSPLKALKEAMKTLVSEPNNELKMLDYKYHLKMFCSIFKSALRDETIFAEKLNDKEDAEDYIKSIIDSTEDIVKKFRDLKDIIHVPGLENKCYALYLFADEFVSLSLDKYRYRMIFNLDKAEVKNKKKIRSELIDLLSAEIEYRKSARYNSCPDEKSDNEELIYRESTLKKLMGSVLFLKTQTMREGIYIEQIVMGLAAGLAMAFATAVAFLSQSKLENFTFSLFMIFVIAYIFKDRMKELTRIFFHRKIQKRLYDRKTNIYNSLNQKIGFCKERFAFFKEKDIPELIKKIRNKDYITELDNGYIGEDIIYSKRFIKILSKKCKNLLDDFNVDGINDIIRFNIRNFLGKMDNPTRPLFMPIEGDIKKIKGGRVYHLNMIIKYGMINKQDIYRKFRIILSRNGIKRIKEIPLTI
ncbi:MAG: hypothetical protein A2017_02405 [Lentisphaerae bacterium GWF2_44_16]|nr:MAG: hypothetical protein A2017_02405 [Lentisphaerae bacterium GWF2_44_16]